MWRDWSPQFVNSIGVLLRSSSLVQHSPKFTNASRVQVAASLQSELDHVVNKLENIAVVNLPQKRSIISLIGNVQYSSLILEKVFQVLRSNNVNVQMISQGASKVRRMPFLLHE